MERYLIFRFGDVYAAFKDCQTALNLDPTYIKAHFRMARALLELGQNQLALSCLNELVTRFPTHKRNHGVFMLREDIKKASAVSSRIYIRNIMEKGLSS